jgi:hypothetical protein
MSPIKCRTITIRHAIMSEKASCIKMRLEGIVSVGAFLNRPGLAPGIAGQYDCSSPRGRAFATLEPFRSTALSAHHRQFYAPLAGIAPQIAGRSLGLTYLAPMPTQRKESGGRRQFWECDAVRSYYFAQVSSGQIEIEYTLALSLSSARLLEAFVRPCTIFLELRHHVSLISEGHWV